MNKPSGSEYQIHSTSHDALRRRTLRSYTNDVARAAETCQAPIEAEASAAEQQASMFIKRAEGSGTRKG
jgi:hypothetical protein